MCANLPREGVGKNIKVQCGTKAGSRFDARKSGRNGKGPKRVGRSENQHSPRGPPKSSDYPGGGTPHQGAQSLGNGKKTTK